jgi:hypothetical protein
MLSRDLPSLNGDFNALRVSKESIFQGPFFLWIDELKLETAYKYGFRRRGAESKGYTP